MLSHIVFCSAVLISHLISSHLISSHLISSHLISSHLISSHLISSHLISSHLISSHLISSHLSSAQLSSAQLSSAQLSSVQLNSSLSFFGVCQNFHLVLPHLYHIFYDVLFYYMPLYMYMYHLSSLLHVISALFTSLCPLVVLPCIISLLGGYIIDCILFLFLFLSRVYDYFQHCIYCIHWRKHRSTSQG